MASLRPYGKARLVRLFGLRHDSGSLKALRFGVKNLPRQLDKPYRRIKFRARKNAFAGRSARRRMKYGYHSVPNGI